MNKPIEIHMEHDLSQSAGVTWLSLLLPGCYGVVVEAGGNWLAVQLDWEHTHRTGCLIIDTEPRLYRCYAGGLHIQSTYDALEAASILSCCVHRPGWRRWLADKLQASHDRETAVQLAARLEAVR